MGIGPGGPDHLTQKAKAAIAGADVIVGYTRYVALVKELTAGKEIFTSGMTQEVGRCEKAIEFAMQGRRVVVVSSGDSGIYGMAGLVFELAASKGLLAGVKPGEDSLRIEVIPGVPAFVSAGAILGAPLMHDFASISLSDLLTPWETIEKRVIAAAQADFVIALYNPKSSQRTAGLTKTVEIVLQYRHGSTPVGIVRNATRPDESMTITMLDNVTSFYGTIDMLTILIIGNSNTYTVGQTMITPRGYKIKKL